MNDHDRMPVILQPANHNAWLGAQTKAEDLKKPLPGDLMGRCHVSKSMSKERKAWHRIQRADFRPDRTVMTCLS